LKKKKFIYQTINTEGTQWQGVKFVLGHSGRTTTYFC